MRLVERTANGREYDGGGLKGFEVTERRLEAASCLVDVSAHLHRKKKRLASALLWPWHRSQSAR